METQTNDTELQLQLQLHSTMESDQQTPVEIVIEQPSTVMNNAITTEEVQQTTQSEEKEQPPPATPNRNEITDRFAAKLGFTTESPQQTPKRPDIHLDIQLKDKENNIVYFPELC